jgi:hypothetical protein
MNQQIQTRVGHFGNYKYVDIEYISTQPSQPL